MKKFIIVLIMLFLIFCSTAMATTFYLDYENGSDVNDGSTWALAWKTITDGATAERIAPGDIIRIAKSSAPTSIGNAEWTNLSKTVTLASAQNLTIDLCETAWTKNATGDATITLTPVGTDAKEGSNCMKIALDSTPQASILQAFFATGELNLSSYQKISFWIKNSGVISEDDWIVNLCSDVAGAAVVDSFLIPAIPSYDKWLPLTLTKEGGGNLGASIKSIAIYSGSGIPLASKYIYVDDFIACTTAGLNLQSLISKNSLEQGGTEGWYGIQSISGVTVLLDNITNTKGNAGKGYSTSGTTPDTVTTYKRETIKTNLAPTSYTMVQEIQDSGTLGSNIEFQGGYDTTSGNQTGETFFDGLNGHGYGLEVSSKSYITLNYLNFCRYSYGIEFNSSNNNTITTLTNTNNNSDYGLYFYSSNNNTITTITNANNNNDGVDFDRSNNNTITTLTNTNNNNYHGVYFYYSYNNTITTITNANNNYYGVYFYYSYNNTIKSLSTAGNVTVGIFNNIGINYLYNALIAEATEVSGYTAFVNSRIFSHKHDQTAYHRIFTDGGQIDSVDTDRPGGTGIMWKLAITSENRTSYYPLDLSIAKIAILADKLVTVKIWMKKDHATNVGGKLVCKGGQITGVSDDVIATKADDFNWEELTITFTPTEVGVVEIEAWAYYSVDNGNVYVEDMTISQAN